jgi:hypothetical protein
LVITRGVAPPVAVCGALVGAVVVPGAGSDGFAGVFGEGVVGAGVGVAGVFGVGVAGEVVVGGCAGVIGPGAGGGAPGGGVAGVVGCAGAGGWANSSALASVTLRIAVTTAMASGRPSLERVMSR